MKEFEFPINFERGANPGLVVTIHIGPSHTAQEFINDRFITPGVTAFLQLLSQSRGLQEAFAITAADKRILSIEASAQLVDRAWPIASILNLIDSATFLQDLADDPFITSVTVETGHLSNLSLDGVFGDMDAFATQCAAQLSPLLEGRFKIEGETHTDWPRDAQEYFFDIEMAFSSPLTGSTEAVQDMFSMAEIALAGTAFELEKKPEDLLEDGLIPFPVKVEVSDNTINYAIETPPSDISIPLILLRDTLKHSFHAEAEHWKVDIRERW